MIASYENEMSGSQNNLPPPQAKYLTWTYTKLASFKPGAAWVQIYNPNIGSDKFKVIYPSTSHAGSQTFRYGHTIKVTLLLDNDPSSQTDPFQFLTVDYMGQTTPLFEHSGSLPMNGFSGQSDNGGGSWSPTSVKAWQLAQTAYSSDMSLSGDGAGDLLLVSESPVNVNNQTSYTSGYQVNIGFNAGATPSGPSAGVSGSYTWVNTQTTTIQDWGCVFSESPNNYQWFWKSQNPGYTTGGYAAEFGGFNNLSWQLFQPTANLVLKTDSPSKKVVELNVKDTLVQAAAVFRHDTAFHYSFTDI